MTRPAAPVGDLITLTGPLPTKQPRTVEPTPQALPPSIVEPSARRADTDRAAASFTFAPIRPTKNPGDRLHLADLTASMCHWPHGEPGHPDFHFCGKPVLTGRPYCAEHEARAYVSGDARRIAENGARLTVGRIVGRGRP